MGFSPVQIRIGACCRGLSLLGEVQPGQPPEKRRQRSADAEGGSQSKGRCGMEESCGKIWLAGFRSCVGDEWSNVEEGTNGDDRN